MSAQVFDSCFLRRLPTANAINCATDNDNDEEDKYGLLERCPTGLVAIRREAGDNCLLRQVCSNIVGVF